MVSSGMRNRISCTANGVKIRLREPRLPAPILPLGKITEQRLELGGLYRLPIPPDGDLTSLLNLLSGPDLKEMIKNSKIHPKDGVKHPPISRNMLRYLPTLRTQGIFGSGRKRKPWNVFIPIFTVPKAGGKECRLIGDCTPLNERLPPPPSMELCALHSVIEGLLDKYWLTQLDAMSYFYQFPLGEHAMDIFVSRVGGPRGIFSTVHWRSMPMGWSYAPAIAQRTSNLFVQNVKFLNPNIALFAWVDNFLFGGDTTVEVNQATRDFEAFGRDVNLTLKEGGQPVQEMEALGMRWDVRDANKDLHHVELSSTHKKALLEGLNDLQTEPTGRKLFGVFGQGMWGTYAVLREPLSLYPHLMSTIRAEAIRLAKSDRKAWDEPINIPSEASRDLECLCAKMMTARCHLGDLKQSPVTENDWSDASGAPIMGWGHVWSFAGQKVSLAAGDHDLDSIFVAELLAAANTWNTAAHNRPGCVPNLHVDNSAAANALLKGHSSNAAGDLILRRLHEQLPPGARAKVTWIPSACNRSDGLSRRVRMVSESCSCGHEGSWVRWRKSNYR